MHTLYMCDAYMIYICVHVIHLSPTLAFFPFPLPSYPPPPSFPDNPPRTKEYYLLRSIFSSYFPAPSAEESVPKGLSIACSTEEAVKWDAAWENTHEISGRAMAGVHEAGTGFGSGHALANGV